jgi:hypothetical protein
VLGGLLLELLRFLTPADAAVGRLAPPVVQALLPKRQEKKALGPSTSGGCRTGNEPEKTSTMPN